jgi:hypothetical protein
MTIYPEKIDIKVNVAENNNLMKLCLSFIMSRVIICINLELDTKIQTKEIFL